MKIGRFNFRAKIEKDAREIGIVMGFYRFYNMRGMYIDISFFKVLMINIEYRGVETFGKQKQKL